MITRGCETGWSAGSRPILAGTCGLLPAKKTRRFPANTAVSLRYMRWPRCSETIAWETDVTVSATHPAAHMPDLIFHNFPRPILARTCGLLRLRKKKPQVSCKKRRRSVYLNLFSISGQFTTFHQALR